MIGLELGYIFNNRERSAGIVRMWINIHNKNPQKDGECISLVYSSIF